MHATPSKCHNRALHTYHTRILARSKPAHCMWLATLHRPRPPLAARMPHLSLISFGLEAHLEQLRDGHAAMSGASAPGVWPIHPWRRAMHANMSSIHGAIAHHYVTDNIYDICCTLTHGRMRAMAPTTNVDDVAATSKNLPAPALVF